MLLTDLTIYLIVCDVLILLTLIFIGFTFISLNFLFIQVITYINKKFTFPFNYWTIQ